MQISTPPSSMRLPSAQWQAQAAQRSVSFAADNSGQPKRYKQNTPGNFDLAVTGLFSGISGLGYLISAANPYIGIPMLGVGAFGAFRQLMHNFIWNCTKAEMI